MPVKAWIVCCLVAACAWAKPDRSCPSQNRKLFYHSEGLAHGGLETGFSDSLFQRLNGPLQVLGYCLTPEIPAVADSQAKELGLWLSARPTEYEVRLTAAVLQESQRSPQRIAQAMRRPLTELDILPGEAMTAAFIFAQKVVENLRTQYVAQVAIITVPDSATIRSDRGLEGKTPLEWVLPLGHLQVTVSHPGYQTREINLDLNRPGEHTANLALMKLRFYHSRFFPYTLGLAASAFGAYLAQNYYYTEYHRLGLEDQRQRPERFGELFRTAKTWENVAGYCLAAAGLGLALSFSF
jgi:PEGA domain